MSGLTLKPPLVYRYITREILSPFFLCIFVFTGVLFLARSLKLVDLVINKNVPVGDMVLLFSYIIPAFLELAIPMSLLLAVILSFGRLSADSEIVVFRAVGLSLTQLARPVFWVAMLALVSTASMGFYVRPWANHKLGQGLFEIARQQTGAALIQGAFNDLGSLTIYAEGIKDQGQSLTNVIIGDDRDPKNQRIFLAKYGKIVSDSEKRSLSLQLYEGSIHEGRGANINVTDFQINSVGLPQSELLDEASNRDEKRTKELMIDELIAAVLKIPDELPTDKDDLRRVQRPRIELQKRLALPVSCLCVALIALALGIQPSRGGHTWGPAVSLGIGVTTILIYYLLFALGSAFAEQAVLPVWVLLWFPNVLYLIVGLYLFKRMGTEQWLAVSQAVGDKLAGITKGIKSRISKRLRTSEGN